VVDHGAAEAATAIVERHSPADSRIQSTPCATGGPSAARNAGIRATTHPWLLFLDAGETLHPTMLARLSDALASGSTLDAVHCGWSVLDDSGRPLVEDRCEAEGDLFVLFTRRCAFPTDGALCSANSGRRTRNRWRSRRASSMARAHGFAAATTAGRTECLGG
jgi:glycosyltransferase involved in cell wall biosynthesis